MNETATETGPLILHGESRAASRRPGARRGHLHFGDGGVTSHDFEVCRDVSSEDRPQLAGRPIFAVTRSKRARTAANETTTETSEDRPSSTFGVGRRRHQPRRRRLESLSTWHSTRGGRRTPLNGTGWRSHTEKTSAGTSTPQARKNLPLVVDHDAAVSPRKSAWHA